MSEQPPIPPRVSKKPKREKSEVTALPKPEWPKHDRAIEDLSPAELLDIVNRYQRIINDLIAQNMQPWATDALISEATNKQAAYEMRRQKLLRQQGGETGGDNKG